MERTYQWLDGSSYEGDFESGVRHGKGHFRWANGEYYKGEYVKDQRTGEGLYAWSDGSVYRGFFLNGTDTAKVFLNQQTEAFIVVNGLMI